MGAQPTVDLFMWLLLPLTTISVKLQKQVNDNIHHKKAEMAKGGNFILAKNMVRCLVLTCPSVIVVSIQLILTPISVTLSPFLHLSSPPNRAAGAIWRWGRKCVAVRLLSSVIIEGIHSAAKR